ncbi:MAG TPA: amidohydrolase family protein [Feifaniaceae bacterium]|nr:amidohydrolase family protein [Feifaniaceae bacterium]
MYGYFHKTELDEAFYAQHLKGRLPARLIDAHAHYDLPEHVKNVTPEAIAGDWALECGLLMSFEDAAAYYQTMLPDTEVYKIALPWPLRDVDTHANNAYVSALAQKAEVRALLTTRPEYDTALVERTFRNGRFSGFKPYPYMASATKGAEVSIFEFFTHDQFALANKLGAPVLMHLPRAGRLPAPENVAEIRVILDRYPNVKLVVAHFGRCFNVEYFERALELFGEDIHRFCFDTAAVINPAVYRLAFAELDYHHILFGTDFPILLWHGRREWKNGTYINLCRENFGWNKHIHPEDEAGYTFFIYEQLKTTLDFIGDNEEKKQAVFYDNAKRVYFDFPQGGGRA